MTVKECLRRVFSLVSRESPGTFSDGYPHFKETSVKTVRTQLRHSLVYPLGPSPYFGKSGTLVQNSSQWFYNHIQIFWIFYVWWRRRTHRVNLELFWDYRLPENWRSFSPLWVLVGPRSLPVVVTVRDPRRRVSEVPWLLKDGVKG